MFPFLKLPREIRDMIYTFALYRGSIEPHRRIIGPPSDALIALGYEGPSGWNGENKGNSLNLALLAVSRHVRDEALSVYLGKNLVVISDNAYNRPLDGSGFQN
ncbi:MAG: hypothetical protein M1830_006712 [Pleopsidium flavum]|nr:MAG: hypothetical protein M1830_006712 [Pleopsidium flavum]